MRPQLIPFNRPVCSLLVIALSGAASGCKSSKLVECREVMVLVARTSGIAFASFDSGDDVQRVLTALATDVETGLIEKRRTGASNALDLVVFRDAYVASLRQAATEVTIDRALTRKNLVQKTAEVVESISVRCSGER